ncbi:ankyrin repeat domain-containing protein [Pontimicrobium sp. IMCC45349]|uniref:ankyrin repeat domain-containing protein n=1 Tax=Pontimicrobium sp. IMCC45349 TaxID=3391574 RepID=UPI00399FA5D9
MKKSIFITVIALGLAIGNVNATNNTVMSATSQTSVSRVSTFCSAIAKGDIETFRNLISNGVNIDKKSNGMTPAMYAAKFNRVDILKILISYGADLDLKSRDGITALNYAKKSNATEAIELLEYTLKKKVK